MFGTRFGKTLVTDCMNAVCKQAFHEHIHLPRNSQECHAVEFVTFKLVGFDKIIAMVNAFGVFVWVWIIIKACPTIRML